MLKLFLQAISFLTVLPVGRIYWTEEKELARSMAFFPAVGLLIGLILSLSYYLISYIFPKHVTLWFIIGILIFLTRGLHLDGFADTMDGLASEGSKDKILEVMRDSRIGTFGVLSLIFLIGAKYLTLYQIPDPFLYPSMISMTILGRNSMVLVCYHSPYARTGEGLGKAFCKNLRLFELIISLFSTFGVVSFLWGLKGILAFLGVSLFSLGFRFYFIKRLAGVTGDILGAANELNELLTVIFLLILIKMEV